MIETLKSSVLSVCLLSISVALCTLLCPNAGLMKQVRFLISLLFLISLAVPLTDLTPPEDLTQIQNQQAQESAIAVTKQCAEQALYQLLEDSQIHCTDLCVTVHIDENQRIIINKVSAVCDDFQNACRVLHEALGEEAEICVTEIIG